jgi:uncharacterized protein (TIGR03437 family)
VKGTLKLMARVAALAAMAASASAYYHFTHYDTANGSFVPIPEKFDLSSLSNQTLYYYVSNQGITRMADGDSFAALLSQIRFAGQTWNGVATSALRVAYGGLFSPDTPQNTPHMEIVFDEMPPGIIAMGSPTTRAEVTEGPDGPFVPILRSTIILNEDLSSFPSYGALPMSIVHEMGHALGLQHTLTSSVMSTSVTRATTKSRPLAGDDVAGISLLYPNDKFRSQFGSLSGRVSLWSVGVHMASVVAVTISGQAISTLSNPDGSYRIDGLPPGQYYVYVHTLPPSVQPELGPSEMVLPLDSDNQPIQAGPSFRTQFYPGVLYWQQASTVGVAAGETTESIDFSVEPRSVPQLYGVTTYSFPGSIAVRPAFVNTSYRPFLVAAGTGLMPYGHPASGMNVSVLGGEVRVAPGGVYPYAASPYYYLQVNFLFTPFSTPGPQHLVFSAGGEVYVLPAGLNVVTSSPPSIDSVTPDVDADDNRVVTITGKGFNSRTRILFDGLEATIKSLDEAEGKLVVTPPLGASEYRAHIVALNSDGQTSQFLQDPPASYSYDLSEAPSVTLSVSSLPAGIEAMIEVDGVNTNFVSGETQLGFGSSDVAVKRLWVLSPTRLRAEVQVASSAPETTTMVTVTSGFQVISQPDAFQILPANPDAVTVNSTLVDPANGRASVYPGGAAVLSVSHLPEGSAPVVMLNDAPVTVVETAEDHITFQVPADMAVGLAVLRLADGESDLVRPIAVAIDPPPPVVVGVSSSSQAVDADHPANPGDLLTVLVTGLGDAGAEVASDRVVVNVGGVDHKPIGAITASDDAPELHKIQIVLSADVPGGPQPLTVSIDGRTSAPYSLALAEKSE